MRTSVLPLSALLLGGMVSRRLRVAIPHGSCLRFMRKQNSDLVLFHGQPQYSFTKADMASASLSDVRRSLTIEGAEGITKLMIIVQ